MIFTEAFLNEQELAQARQLAGRSQWVDGRRTAAGVAGAVKRNEQLVLNADDGARLAALVVHAVQASMGVFRMTLPAEISMPMINGYAPGMSYGAHYDAPSFRAPGGGNRMRADLSATIFLSDPAQYAGGELVMLLGGQEREIKLPAGHIVIYPSSLLHEVREVRSGVRHAIVFWIQSMIQDHESRALFYRLDQAIEKVSQQLPNSQEVRDLTGVFSGLGRLWLQP